MRAKTRSLRGFQVSFEEYKHIIGHVWVILLVGLLVDIQLVALVKLTALARTYDAVLR